MYVMNGVLLEWQWVVDDDNDDVVLTNTYDDDDTDDDDDDDVVPTRVMYEWSECIWIASQPPLPNTIKRLTHQPAHDDDDDDDVKLN